MRNFSNKLDLFIYQTFFWKNYTNSDLVNFRDLGQNDVGRPTMVSPGVKFSEKKIN